MLSLLSALTASFAPMLAPWLSSRSHLSPLLLSARRPRYRAVLEVTDPIEQHASHGAAWEVHGARALPHSLTRGTVRSGAEAQRFYERNFYNGQTLRNTPVLAIPIRVVAWHAS